MEPLRHDLDGCLGLALGIALSLAAFALVIFLFHECYHVPGRSHELSEEPPAHYQRVMR